MTTEQFDALVDLITALIADNEAQRDGTHKTSDTIELFRVMDKVRTLLVTED